MGARIMAALKRLREARTSGDLSREIACQTMFDDLIDRYPREGPAGG